MAERIRWTEGERSLTCRVCAYAGPAALIATVTELAQVDMPVVRCPQCGSLTMTDEPLEIATTDWAVDQYVENGAGLGAILDTILLADIGRVRRFLDVGCNYGFAVDMGRTLFGWEAVGVEPSLAGRRGAAELGCDIRSGYLAADTDMGAPFDLVMASEVLEHVPEPLSFLTMLHERVVPGGMLVLTTPAAEVVVPYGPEQQAIVAISPGFHVFLPTERGLGDLLARAGFGDVNVVRRGGTLHAIGHRSPQPASTRRGRRGRSATSESRDQLLGRYFTQRLATAPPNSVVAVGLATRALREFSARGDWAQVAAIRPAVVQAYLGQHGIDLSDPVLAAQQFADAPQCTSFALGGAAYALGMNALLSADDPSAARAWFDLCTQALTRWRSVAGEVDHDSHDLLRQASYHSALAASRFDPADAAARALHVAEPDRQCRLLVELVVRGTTTGLGELCDRVEAAVEQLQAEADGQHGAVLADAMYALGAVAMAAHDNLAALRWFLRCISAADADPSLQHVGTLARDHVRQVHQRLAAPPMQPVGLQHMVDVYWCDASGTYLSGWVVVPGRRLDDMRVHIGNTSVPVTRHQRPDLVRHWPQHEHAADGGFSVYVAGSPHGRVVLQMLADGEPIEVPLDVDRGPLPARPPSAPMVQAAEMYQAALSLAPPGPVLVLGMREPDEVEVPLSSIVAPDRFVVSVDIHPGTGVTVVGDAHTLSSFLRPQSFAAVLSVSVLEHVAAPWVVAAEIARVLMPGGIAMHAVPWTWPTHSLPNDFWRMSPGGLASLFGPSLGFEVLRTEVHGNAVVTPEPEWRAAAMSMPTTVSAAMCSVLARKLVPTPHTHWPLDAEESARSARHYPVDGLSPAKDPR